MTHKDGVSGMLRSLCFSVLVSLLVLVLLFAAASGAKSDDEDEDDVTFRDFSLNIGDRIDLGKYQMELVEIQSLRDGLVVMRVLKVGGSLDEQRALLLSSPNNFDRGADNGGITITVVDIYDEQSAKVRLEYMESLGTPRKRASDRPALVPDKPELSVQKSFDKTVINVGDEVKVTLSVENKGTGPALEINADDTPPLPEFTYVVGYPPRIKETLQPGESDSAIYVMNAVKEGLIRIPAVIVSYTDGKKNPKSNSSESFSVMINPRSKADLEITVQDIAPLALDGSAMLNISISNLGSASATRIESRGDVSPPGGLQISGLEKSIFEIPPGDSINFSAAVSGQKPGDYTIGIKVSYNDGGGSVIRETAARVVVLEREYKYQYLLLIIPIAIILAWIYRRHKEYKY
ncbi:MAG: BatD family protein [Methanothrix sp.]|jgi:uncharacterized repeat protein (TIGR01451 family)|nr:BatD family protein [Methanothrix sp.]